MKHSVSKQDFDAAMAYESLHVPALFAQWAPRIADTVSLDIGMRILDVACGTGVFAREAASRVAGTGFVAGLDTSPGMLAAAAHLAPNVEWTHGRAESLPYDDASFDVVVCQFGLMFFEDRVGGLREMKRVLKHGGRICVAVWESLECSEAYPQEVDLIERLAGKRAADALKAPFVLGDVDRLSALFTEAGFESVEVTTHRGTAVFPSIRSMVEADLRGWLPVMGVSLDDSLIEAILVEAETALSRFVITDGRVEFDIPAHIVVGTRADADHRQ